MRCTTTMTNASRITYVLSRCRRLVVQRSVLCLLPGPADGLDQVGFRDLLPAREVARSDLRVDLNARVRGQEVFYQGFRVESLMGYITT